MLAMGMFVSWTCRPLRAISSRHPLDRGDGKRHDRGTQYTQEPLLMPIEKADVVAHFTQAFRPAAPLGCACSRAGSI